ncbi:MAG: hypothetical protein RL095_1072 [Verrucomicrobiota bacterium]|jgi:hypothetical protein
MNLLALFLFVMGLACYMASRTGRPRIRFAGLAATGTSLLLSVLGFITADDGRDEDGYDYAAASLRGEHLAAQIAVLQGPARPRILLVTMKQDPGSARIYRSFTDGVERRLPGSSVVILDTGIDNGHPYLNKTEVQSLLSKPWDLCFAVNGTFFDSGSDEILDLISDEKGSRKLILMGEDVSLQEQLYRIGVLDGVCSRDPTKDSEDPAALILSVPSRDKLPEIVLSEEIETAGTP